MALGITLLSATDTTGPSVRTTGGYKNLFVIGTWDGATAQLQWSPDGGTTWINIDGVSLTANGGWSAIPVASGHCRITISGAGGTTSLSSELEDIS